MTAFPRTRNALAQSISTGAFSGKQPVGAKRSYDYRLEYARQTDYADNPVDYDADYVRIEQWLTYEGFTPAAPPHRLRSTAHIIGRIERP